MTRTKRFWSILISLLILASFAGCTKRVSVPPEQYEEVIVGEDFIYVTTSNGVDGPHKKVVNPDAPSLIVLDKKTGRLLALDGQEIGSRLYHAQWSSPSLGTVGKRTLVFLGGGDGVCYAFEALSTKPEKPASLKKVWSYDCNPREYKYRGDKLIPYYEGDKRKRYSTNKNDGNYVGPNQIIASPVFHNNRIYVAVGQDPAHGRGKGLFYCIDATKTGDITESGNIWSYDGIERSISVLNLKPSGFAFSFRLRSLSYDETRQPDWPGLPISPHIGESCPPAQATKAKQHLPCTCLSSEMFTP